MAYIEIDGKNIYYEEYGKADSRAIAYFHGGPGANCMDFAAQAKALGETFRVISFDQYGCLRSDAHSDGEAFGIRDQAALILKMQNKMKIPSWSLIGHSYGGMLACLYTHTNPDRVDAVIYDCPSWNFVLSSKSIAAFVLPYFQRTESVENINKCNDIINKDYTLNKQNVVDDLLAVLNEVKDGAVRQYLHSITIEELDAHYPIKDIPKEFRKRGQTHFSKIIESGEMLFDYLPYLNQIPYPSLLLVGKYDPACCAVQREYFVNHAKNGKMIEFENSGHFPRIEETEKYLQTVTDFLLQVIRLKRD
jgi:proline iminopeptidase